MNSLLNYGSDDDLDDSSDEKNVSASYGSTKSLRKYGTIRQDDANYDEVQMSLSEDSSDESKSARDPPPGQSHDRSRDDFSRRERRERSDSRERYSTRDRNEERNDKTKNSERYQARDREEIREKYSSTRDKEDSRMRDDDRNRDRDRYKTDRDDDKHRDRRDDRRAKSKERYGGRDDRYRDRKDRDRRRSRSPRDRDRRRSRSRSPRRYDGQRSSDRGGRGGFSKRFDCANKMERLDKMGIEMKKDESMSNAQNMASEDQPKDRFFVPGITGRFREQIEKRKLLWQKKEPAKTEAVVRPTQRQLQGAPRATKVWEATTFAQDSDGKVANKFKRLMGIKNVGEGSKPATEVLKKQEEMFSSMEQQYEVARTATHTMRGVGLGFGSYQR